MAKPKSFVPAGGVSATKPSTGASARDAQIRAQSPAGRSSATGGQTTGAAGNTNPFAARQQAQNSAAFWELQARTADAESAARYTGRTAYTGSDGRLASDVVSASGAYGGPSPSGAPTAFDATRRKLSELLQQQAELQAAKEVKQTALDEAKRDADAAQKNRIQQRQQAQPQSAFAELQANMAKDAAKKSAASSPYALLPVQWPRLAVPGEDEDWTKRANIKNLSERSKNLVGLIAQLPKDFPIDTFDTMLPKQQLAAVQRTELTREEQWALLNARTNIKALSEVMDVQENRRYYGLSQAQADAICQELLEIDNARIGTWNHEVPLATERQRKAFLKILDEREGELLSKLGEVSDNMRATGMALPRIPTGGLQLPIP